MHRKENVGILFGLQCLAMAILIENRLASFLWRTVDVAAKQCRISVTAFYLPCFFGIAHRQEVPWIGFAPGFEAKASPNRGSLVQAGIFHPGCATPYQAGGLEGGQPLITF